MNPLPLVHLSPLPNQRRPQQFNERRRPARDQAAAGGDAPEGDRGQGPVRENALEQAAFYPGGGEAVVEGDDAEAVRGHFALQAGGVGGERAAGDAFPVLVAAREAPGHGFAVAADELQGDVVEQFRRAGRFAVALQVGRAGVEAVDHVAELAGDQRGVVGQAGGGTDGEVEALGKQVDAARRKVEFQPHFRVARGVVEQYRRQVEFAEVGRHGNAQHAARRSLAELGDGGGGFGFFL